MSVEQATSTTTNTEAAPVVDRRAKRGRPPKLATAANKRGPGRPAKVATSNLARGVTAATGAVAANWTPILLESIGISRRELYRAMMTGDANEAAKGFAAYILHAADVGPAPALKDREWVR